MVGDMTNDGTAEQHELLKQCLEEVLSDKRVLSVTGNHDIPRIPLEQEDRQAVRNHLMFQKWLFEKMEQSGNSYRVPVKKWKYGPDGAWAVSLGNVELFGLQAVADQRRFLFEGGRQLEWLDGQMSETQEAPWRIILCRAPLLHHNPKRKAGENNPYLNRDKQLQEVADRWGNVILFPGTHIYP